MELIARLSLTDGGGMGETAVRVPTEDKGLAQLRQTEALTAAGKRDLDVGLLRHNSKCRALRKEKQRKDAADSSRGGGTKGGRQDDELKACSSTSGLD